MTNQGDACYSTDTRIRAEDDYDVYLWSLVLRSSPEEILRVARQVGFDAKAVQSALDPRAVHISREA